MTEHFASNDSLLQLVALLQGFVELGRCPRALEGTFIGRVFALPFRNTLTSAGGT